MRRPLSMRWAVTALAIALLAAACSGADNDSDDDATSGLSVDVISTRADYVSGGDALVQVTGGANPSGLSVTVEGDDDDRDVSDRFGPDGVGLITDLPEGVSTIVAEADGNRAEIAVTNHSITGPMFSGPHLPLEVCTTQAFGLGEAVDDDCSAAEPSVSWRYMSTDGTLKDLPDPTERPADLTTGTVDGDTVDLIVRDEVGTINRSVYFLSIPDPEPDPSISDPAWDARGWNGALVYQFGGGCGTSYSQGSTLLGGTDPELFEAGYATATATFNTFQTQCNDVLSAETALMVKEHFSEAYGPPSRTIGSGGSGGAIQQYLIAQNYPGILDAIAPTVPFPDAATTAAGVTDCGLLLRFYRSVPGRSWTTEQQVAVNGHLTPGTCMAWEATFLQGIDADSGCATDLGAVVGGTPVDTVDPERIYDAETNPEGLRCTLQDSNVNVFGTDPETGFARRALDSVGVQYGLAALNDGIIDFDQFVELNESIGGYDIDGDWMPDRTEADDGVIEAAYATGRVITGDGPLADTPIITVDVYTDHQGDIHDRFRAFSVDDRLAGGDGEGPAPLHNIWTRPLPDGSTLVDSLSGSVPIGVQLTRALDEWLIGIDEGDAATDPPAAAVSRCLLGDDTEEVAVDVNAPGGPCEEDYPIKGDPRTAAGAARANDTIKCSLQPVADAASGGIYASDLTATQVARVEATFPDGVCDWTRPGVGQVGLAGTWLDYGADPAIRE